MLRSQQRHQVLRSERARSGVVVHGNESLGHEQQTHREPGFDLGYDIGIRVEVASVTDATSTRIPMS